MSSREFQPEGLTRPRCIIAVVVFTIVVWFGTFAEGSQFDHDHYGYGVAWSVIAMFAVVVVDGFRHRARVERFQDELRRDADEQFFNKHGHDRSQLPWQSCDCLFDDEGNRLGKKPT